ncbi:TSP1-like protein [Mya arenaria]|uniref:TSP1-like protein n=1 Tax=Mya arenaria TaxID=6604 RepID=A0ABY7G796_MYAAR|nr:TSP1-like protein [Mya arenaria]
MFHPVTGAWGEWGSWMACSISCGTGYSARYRICDSSAPLFDGNDCFGSARSYKQCNIGPCPINGAWSEWSVWGTCSQTCDTGVKQRGRTCANPSPAHGGQDCVGNSTDAAPCMIQETCKGCPAVSELQHAIAHARIRHRHLAAKIVSGQILNLQIALRLPRVVRVSSSENYSLPRYISCSVTCGTGIQTRHRACANPSPTFGGQNCKGTNHQTTSCTEPICRSR